MAEALRRQVRSQDLIGRAGWGAPSRPPTASGAREALTWRTRGGAAYLEIRNVTKRFSDFVALSDVSLDVREGEFVCFLGPSGCGKTTLLRAIAGLDIQTSGTIRQAGRDISALPPERRDFGIVFQSYALFPNLSVRQNIAFGLREPGDAAGRGRQARGRAARADRAAGAGQEVSRSDFRRPAATGGARPGAGATAGADPA